MSSAKLLISLPDELSARFRALVPRSQRSQLIRKLIRKEIDKREQALYECAVAVEKDSALSKDMENWTTTLNDGFDSNETW